MSANHESRIDALLVGYENQENLGLRSIMSYLQSVGMTAALAPFLPEHEADSLALVRKLRPRLIGFSLIFQYTLEEFGKLMRFLRAEGVDAHFTAGGHFPSLRPGETLELLPELDSIVRFEGELTLVELLKQLADPPSWDRIPGLAFRRGAEVAATAPRPLLADLDRLPWIHRDGARESAGGIKMASMLASRGCLYNCSFCSIRQFYGGAPGTLRRTRSPRDVVAEMVELHKKSDVEFFSFQDDDFATRTVEQQRWLREFLDGLDGAGLKDRVRWKISCRVDDLEPTRLKEMTDHGLTAVYLGVESGSPTGLRALNKHVTPEQNLTAVNLLKQQNLAMSIGFMLFDPSSTVDSVHENLRFLRTVGEDGYFPINFCKMLPYAGTSIEDQLRAAGRLTGTVTRPNYQFLDPQLDDYEYLVQRIFTRRNSTPEGLVSRLQAADFDARLTRAFGRGTLPPKFDDRLRELIGRSNRMAVDTLERMLDEMIAHGTDYLLEEQKTLPAIAESEWRDEAAVGTQLRSLEQLLHPEQT